MNIQRLKHVAGIRVSNVDKKSIDGDVPVRLCNYTDVYYNERITSDLPFMDATATPDQLVTFALRAGDVVLTKDSETADDIGVSAVVVEDVENLVCGYHLAVVRPKAGVADGPFLRWVLAGDPARQAMAMAATGVTRFGLRSEAIADLQVPLPPLYEQRAIREYLDRETTRIDALIATKRQMAGLLKERWQAVLEDRIQRLVRDCGPIPLKYVCREITVGIVVTPAAWYADSGVPAIRGMNLSPGSISLEDIVYLSDEGHRLHPKSQLRAGDVLVVRTGQAGTAAVVPPELEGANCIDLVIIRLQPSYEPRFLEYVLNSDWMQKHVAEHSVGTIQGHFNVGAASLVPVPQAPPDVQREVVAELSEYRSQIAETRALLDKQSSLLIERRQALITAAVTGDLSAPVAA